MLDIEVHQTPLDFELSEELEAHEPPEARGTPRDHVRLMISHRCNSMTLWPCCRFLGLPYGSPGRLGARLGPPLKM